jgi:indolepyruvate ferredoxin oxidoreductase alpha subunit
VGLLKLGTTWPLPPKLLKRYLNTTQRILFVEEVIQFLEEQVKVLAAEEAASIGIKTFYGKNDGTIPMNGELNPDIVTDALGRIMQVPYALMSPEYENNAQISVFNLSPNRDQTFCPGCPHRASFWIIHQALQLDNRQGFVCGDNGCYSMGIMPSGFSTIRTMHSMGSGMGLASGFGKLDFFGLDQPVLAVCGDSTFFHAVIPSLVNAVHNRSKLTLVVLDNSGTAMTGFQPHPGLNINALGKEAPKVDISRICEAIGAKVLIRDPFKLEESQQALSELIEEDGVKVLILRQICALSPEKRGKKKYFMSVEETLCLGEACGCNRLCTRVFRCPGLVWDKENGRPLIDEVICTGCGVCALICPAGAIANEEVPHS